MKNLKKLEKKYQELGQEIERLKNSEVQYPIYCLSKKDGLIIKFDGLNSGIAVKQSTLWDIRTRSSFDWTSHTNTMVWEKLEVCSKTGFYDGQLVWCWDDEEDTHQRTLRFFDALNHLTFSNTGRRDGLFWQNYEPYEGNWPEWAQEAFKTLKR